MPTRTHVFRNTAVVIVSLLTACVEIMFRPAQLAVDPVHADPDYRLYADAAMVALQDMYQPSTGNGTRRYGGNKPIYWKPPSTTPHKPM